MSANAHPQLDGYRITRVIGHGGMSTVYLAEQPSLGRKVALKIMLADALADEVSRARFENEARTIARLQHPHIVGIHDVGRTRDGLPFYAMPYLPRGHLAQRKLAGDQPKVAAILRPLLQALDYAHVRGIVHRDVKAENVLFDDADRPLLADFGIALRRGSNPRLTHAGLAVGSTAYMPPEQARGLEVDRRADIYSLGVLTWEMLVGRLPYNAGDALSMALKHVQEPVPRLPAPLRHWQGFIDRAMAKKPADRFASAQDMLAALDALEKRTGKAFVAVDVPASVPVGQPQPERSQRWQKLRIPLAAAAAVLLAGSALTYALLDRPDAEATPAHTVATPATSSLPAPAEAAQTGLLVEPPADAGNASAYIANAEQQLRDGRLLSPANANAWDSLDAAWRLQPTAADTQRLTAGLFDALGDAADSALRSGDTANARLAFQRASELDARRGGSGEAVALLRKRMETALDARLHALLGKHDTQAASSLLDAAGWVGIAPAKRRALTAQVQASGKAVPVLAATAVAATPAAPVAAAPAPVVTISRADYTRFANATERAPAECGKGLFGRKRSWHTMGNDRRPVVCVSAADAQAFAGWLGAQDGHRYRLPSAGEIRAQGDNPVAGWLTLCADHACSQRMASGKPQPLDASRGYEDIGIRLARID